MRLSSAVLVVSAISSVTSSTTNSKNLIVSDTPQFIRPYILPYLSGSVLSAGTVAYRFPITSNSSGGAFTLLTTNTNTATSLSVLAHKHIARYENFFCSRGSVQLWLGKNGTNEQDGRELGPMDFGASSPWTTHTFQTMAPDTEMYGVVFPGGLEDLFYSTFPTPINFTTPTPYDPSNSSPPTAPTNTTAPPPPPPATGDFFSNFDIYPDPAFTPRRDFANGSAPASAGWHVANNSLPANSTTPYFVAKDFGPKYLSKDPGGYQVIQPLTTAVQSGSHNFSLSWITMSKLPANSTAPLRKYAGHAAFKVEVGAMDLAVEGYGTELMLQGDVAFIPAGTGYRYWGRSAATRVLAVSAGAEGLASDLIKGGKSWDWPVWPGV